MKKIVLGCAAVLLSLGLLAGCNNDTDSAVTISVDKEATVVVGETLELPYTVEPEKAKVEVLNDHEEYVAASADAGLLCLDGIAAGSATITLVGTYKKYTEANVSIAVSVVTKATEDSGPGEEEPGNTGDTEPGEQVITLSVDATLDLIENGDPATIVPVVTPEEAKISSYEITDETFTTEPEPDDEDAYVISVTPTEEGYTVTPGAQGTANIVFTASLEGYDDVTATTAVTVHEEGWTETEEELLGSFDFSSNTYTNTGISTTDGLDEFWFGEELYLGARQHSSVYLGCDGGALSGETSCIKLGTTTAGGLLQLKFELGTCVSKVVVTAHSWTTDTANTLTVNGVSEECSTSGEPEAITYTITDDLTYLVTIESNVGLTVHGIEIYGTYEPDRVESITALSITAEQEELEIGDSTEISVSWEPATTVFDIDELVWTSSDSDAVSVNSTPNGAEVHALDATEEAIITATATNGVYATCGIKVNALEEEGLYGIYNFSKLTSSYTKEQTSGSSTHHLTTTELEAQLGVAWTGANSNENPVTSVTDTSRVDDYNPTTSGWVQEEASLGYLKTGSSSAVGYMSLSLSVEVVKVVVNCHSWTTGTTNQMVSVVDGGEEQVSSTSGTATDLTFEISSTDSLKIQGNYRVFIVSIALYTE